MHLEKIQQLLFTAYDIKNVLPNNIKFSTINVDSGETVLDYINDMIEILETLEAEVDTNA